MYEPTPGEIAMVRVFGHLGPHPLPGGLFVRIDSDDMFTVLTAPKAAVERLQFETWYWQDQFPYTTGGDNRHTHSMTFEPVPDSIQALVDVFATLHPDTPAIVDDNWMMP